MSDVVLKPVRPSQPGLRLSLLGSASRAGGAGGWASVARARRTPVTEWTGTPETTLTVPLILDGLDGQRPGRDESIEPELRRLRRWSEQATKKTDEPVVLRVSGLLEAAASERWVINGVDVVEEIRDRAGRRVQAKVTLTLLLHNEPVIARGPAERNRKRRKDKKGGKNSNGSGGDKKPGKKPAKKSRRRSVRR